MPNYNGSIDSGVLATLTRLMEKQDTRLDRLENAIVTLKDAIVTASQQTQQVLKSEIDALETEVDTQATTLSRHETKIGFLEESIKRAQLVIEQQSIQLGKQQQFIQVVGAIALAAVGTVATFMINNALKPATASPKKAEIAIVRIG